MSKPTIIADTSGANLNQIMREVENVLVFKDFQEVHSKIKKTEYYFEAIEIIEEYVEIKRPNYN